MYKVCSACKVSKLASEFNIHKRMQDGLRSTCKPCHSEENRRSYLKNQSKRQAEARIRTAEWRTRPGNAEKNRASALAWAALPKNAETARRRATEWAIVNEARRQSTYRKRYESNKWVFNSRAKAYKARKRNSIPSWANKFFIAEAYDIAAKRTAMTGIEWHVDHIVPLKGKTVCGFHTEQNLQVIPGRSNLSKSNRYWPDMP